MLREMCRSFADKELAPNAGEWDKNHTFPKDQVRQGCAGGCMRPRSLLLRPQAAARSLGVGHHTTQLACSVSLRNDKPPYKYALFL